jgi:HPt (histidine-containing phosphotransfer) domain-containing protein
LDSLEERTGGDLELMAEIVSLSFSRWPDMMARIERAVKSQDSRELEAAVHNLRGDFVSLQAQRASEVALELEIKGRTRDCSGLEEIAVRLQAEVEILTPILASVLQGRFQG